MMSFSTDQQTTDIMLETLFKCFFKYIVHMSLALLRSESPLHNTLHQQLQRNHWYFMPQNKQPKYIMGRSVTGSKLLEFEHLHPSACECSQISAGACAHSLKYSNGLWSCWTYRVNAEQIWNGIWRHFCLPCTHYLHAFLAHDSHTSVSYLDHTDIIGTITYREKVRNDN